MKKIIRAFAAVIIVAAAQLSFAQQLQPLAPPINALTEYRQCGPAKRAKDGSIYRSQAVISAYRKVHPCPSTGKTTGACPDWALNHTIPLAKGGCDSVVNLSWVPNKIKSCSSDYCIDRWERSYYGDPYGIIKFSSTPEK